MYLMWPLAITQGDDIALLSLLEHTEFHTNMWENNFLVRMMEHWNRMPRDVVEYSSAEIFKTLLVTYLCNLL